MSDWRTYSSIKVTRRIHGPAERRNIHPDGRYAFPAATRLQILDLSMPMERTPVAYNTDGVELIARASIEADASRRVGRATIPSGQSDGLAGSKIQSGGGEAHGGCRWKQAPLSNRRRE